MLYRNAIREILERINGAMRTGAALVLGAHEQLPEQFADTAIELSAWFEKQAIYRSGNAGPSDAT